MYHAIFAADARCFEHVTKDSMEVSILSEVDEGLEPRRVTSTSSLCKAPCTRLSCFSQIFSSNTECSLMSTISSGNKWSWCASVALGSCTRPRISKDGCYDEEGDGVNGA